MNIYEVPVTYFPYINIKRESLADRVKVKSHQKFKSYISSKKLLDPDSWNFEILKGENIAGSIVEYANKTKPDAVIVGRIGQTNLPGNILSIFGEPCDAGGLVVIILSRICRFHDWGFCWIWC
ncbi:MAG: hypothetical protein R2784_03560 [Saprospiraceae bacterium]